jgi:hypothetical protein
MHRVRFENYAADGKGLAEGAAAPGYVQQLPGPFVVPTGPAGGPLQGASLSGPAPATLPGPHLDNPLLVLGVLLAAGQGPLEPPVERSLPYGPFNISLIEDDPAGLAVTITFGDVQVGDTVLLEATGNSAVNGSYTVLAVSDMTVVVDNMVELTAPIENKGRLTVTG